MATHESPRKVEIKGQGLEKKCNSFVNLSVSKMEKIFGVCELSSQFDSTGTGQLIFFGDSGVALVPQESCKLNDSVNLQPLVPIKRALSSKPPFCLLSNPVGLKIDDVKCVGSKIEGK